ncbi:MAG TPA: glycoside hydrolase domain-containing protein, partial [Armatimonadota bacterium]|nr:glycoside hydrolase domain-containing protein [Armatimonadota bacterium]
QDGPPDEFFEEIAGPHADVWNYNGGVGTPERVARAIADGHIIACYNNDVEGYRPELQRYAAGMYLLASGTQGIYNWEYHGWQGSPYDDQDAQYGDFLHVYPAMGDEVGGPSTGWEGFREGTDDYKYCDLLRRTIERARGAGHVAEADAAAAVLDEIFAGLNYQPRIRQTAKWERSFTDDDGVARISGKLLVPNGWEYADYDSARRRVADQIVGLLRVLGELPAG